MSIADELITRGWTQGQAKDDDGRVCLVNAALLAYSDAAMFLRAVAALVEVTGHRAVSVWNDAPGRTFDEVLRAAKEADAILDAEVPA